jgi:DNA-binding response OmpR family regulator
MAYARILIVEDEPILALELQEDLQDLGFEVVDVVYDGDMVKAAVIKGKPDLILMDVKLYGWRDGIDVASELRSFCPAPIIFMTSYAKDDIARRIEGLSAASYIGKPYRVNQLEGVIGAALEGRG